MAFSPCSCCRNVFSCSGNANFRCNIYKRLDRTSHMLLLYLGISMMVLFIIVRKSISNFFVFVFVFQGEYLFIGAGLFTIVFCIIEMDKPDQPHNFEPQIYNMERGSRDKLIADYNTMDIWDFNEKYGDLWDFTVKAKDDITKR